MTPKQHFKNLLPGFRIIETRSPNKKKLIVEDERGNTLTHQKFGKVNFLVDRDEKKLTFFRVKK